jgi:uncharacterized protein
VARGPTFLGHHVAPGDLAELRLKVSENAGHEPMELPVTVARGPRAGPTLYVTSAIHGDEIVGVAVVRRLLAGIEGMLERGNLVALPVVNRPGFESGSRYLPDRRDLNRSFPGDARGNMAQRIADTVFRAVVRRADFGVDLHTAAAGHANLCHVRGDADKPGVRRLLRAFGTPIMVHGVGPKGSLRRAATQAGVPTIVFEAGEPGRFQRHAVEVGHHGLVRLMGRLGMAPRERARAPLQILVRKSSWIRSDHGGIVDLEVEPGELVRRQTRVATITEPLGRHVDEVLAPRDGVVLGTATRPLAFPGVALAHVGSLARTFARAADYVADGGDLGRLSWRTRA